MKQIRMVFLFTLKDAARKKAFKISTAFMAILVLILCALPRLISSGETDTSSPAQSGTESEYVAPDTEQTALCYYIDADNLIPNGRLALTQAMPDTKFVASDAESLEGLKQKVADNADTSIIVVENGENAPNLTFITKDFRSGISSTTATEALSKAYIETTLQSQGIDGQTVEFARSTLPMQAEYAGPSDFSGYLIGILLTILVFFAIYYYGYGVAMSVATEKTSRVMETLIVCAKPRNILLGKVLAMGVLGLLQFVGVLLFGVICYQLLVPDNFTMMGMELSFAAFTPASAILVVLYFILGYSLYAVLNAVCGATVSKIEDLNSAMMPVMLVAIISFYISYISAIATPGGGLEKAAMYIPLTSPFIMPFKLLNGDVAAADIAISLVLLLAAIAVVCMISIKIYSASVLHYGKRLKIKDALKK